MSIFCGFFPFQGGFYLFLAKAEFPFYAGRLRRGFSRIFWNMEGSPYRNISFSGSVRKDDPGVYKGSRYLLISLNPSRCWGQNRSRRNQRQKTSKEVSSFKRRSKIQKNRDVSKTQYQIRNNFEEDSHDKSSRKVTQGLGQWIPNNETPIVQLAEGTSWTGCTDQLARSASWISLSRRTGELDRASQAVQFARSGSWT